MLVASTIYLLLFKAVEFQKGRLEQVELLRGVACCFSVWRLEDLCLVPRHHHSRPRNYSPRSSSFLHHPPFFVHSARLLLLGTIPLVPWCNFSFLHSRFNSCNSLRPQLNPWHSLHPWSNASHSQLSCWLEALLFYCWVLGGSANDFVLLDSG